MVSLFSLFTSKKKSRPSPTSEAAPTDSSTRPTRPRPVSRFLSLRSRSSSRPHNLADRRASSELTRRKSLKRNGLPTELPKLDLGFEVDRLTGDGLMDPSESQKEGWRARLTPDELQILDTKELTIEEGTLGWKWFGQALKDPGMDLTNTVVPEQPEGDIKSQQYLEAVFIVTIRPGSESSFPSVVSRYRLATSVHEHGVWLDRLLSALKKCNNGVDITEAMKWMSRRLSVSLSISQDPSYTAVRTAAAGFASRQTEQDQGYSSDFFDTLPHQSHGFMRYLDEVCDVWSTMVLRSDDDVVNVGRLSSLLGWWIWELESRSNLKQWSDLYRQWVRAREQIELFFYSWIRYQASRREIASRLVQLAAGYLRAKSTLPKQLPTRPGEPPKVPHQALHLALSCRNSTATRSQTPKDILQAAIDATPSNGSHSTVWRTLLDKRKESHLTVDSVRDLLCDSSRSFVDRYRTSGPQDAHLVQSSPAHLPIPPNKGPLYRPFSTLSPRSNVDHDDHQRLHFYGDYFVTAAHNGEAGTPDSGLSDVENTPRVTDDPQARLHVEAPSASPITAPDPTLWEDFTKTGFPDSPVTADLALSPPTSPVTLSPDPQQVTSPPHDETTIPQLGSRETSFVIESLSVYSIVSEEVVPLEMDFVAFVEDGQLDPTAIRSWPLFALVRLREPLVHPDRPEQAIACLLVSLVQQSSLLVEADQKKTFPRSPSPGTASSSSRLSNFGLRDFTATLRRSSSFGQKGSFRNSIFGASSRSKSTQGLQAEALTSLSEERVLAPPNGVASHMAIAGGEIPHEVAGYLDHRPDPRSKAKGDVDRTALDTAGSTGSPESTSPPASGSTKMKSATVMTEALSTGRPMDQPEGMEGREVCEETAPSDWSYKLEGAAHVVYEYRGMSLAYAAQVLRVPKSHIAPDQDGVRGAWRDRLLPQLIPSALRVSMTEVALDSRWLVQLMDSTDTTRPGWRRVGTQFLANDETSPRKAYLMENLTSSPVDSGIETILSIEIKPKWGFLPSPQFLQPLDSIPIKGRNCRYCLHQHLRGISDDSAQFCPLDLYSGDDLRMGNALDTLWSTWTTSDGTANNWRVYVDGKRISRAESALITRATPEGNLITGTTPLILPILQSSGVLSVIQTLQSTLDATDISDLVARFRTEDPNSELFAEDAVPEPNEAELEEFVKLYLSDRSGGKREGLWSFRQRLIAYSLSAIFKDCSIIISAVLTSSSTDTIVIDRGKSSVKLIDLDLKPMRSLRKWAERDETIWRHWLGTKALGQSLPNHAGHQSTQSTNVDQIDHVPSTPSSRIRSGGVSPETTPMGGTGPTAPLTDNPKEQPPHQSADGRESRGDALTPGTPGIQELRSAVALKSCTTVETASAQTSDSPRLSLLAVHETSIDSSPKPRTARSLAPSPSPHPEEVPALISAPAAADDLEPVLRQADGIQDYPPRDQAEGERKTPHSDSSAGSSFGSTTPSRPHDVVDGKHPLRSS